MKFKLKGCDNSKNIVLFNGDTKILAQTIYNRSMDINKPVTHQE